MRNFLSSLTLLLPLVACAAETSWHKPGAATQDFYTDQGQCKAQSYAQNNVAGPRGGVENYMGVNLLQARLIQDACLEGKGWRLIEVKG